MGRYRTFPSLLVVVALLVPAGRSRADEAAAGFPAGWRQGYLRSVAGQKLSYHWAYPGFAVSLLSRAIDPGWAIAWEAEEPPAVAADALVTYVWHAGLNSGPEPHRFELRLDGRPLVPFDTGGGTERRAWAVDVKDGVRLEFRTTRLGSFDERFGFMELSLPRRLLGEGRPRLSIVPEAAGSQDYVLVFEEPVRAWARVAAEEAVLTGGRRLLTADVSHLGPSTPVVATAGGREIFRGVLATGHTQMALPVPEGVTGSVAIRLEAAGVALLDEVVALAPVPTRVFHLVPHSHVDIGYSDPQPAVERKQWKNLGDAVALARATRAQPEGARFRWEAEGLWAVESFLAQASPAERAAFEDAVARGEIELPMNLTNVLTGLCHPEELARWTDAARRLQARYGLRAAPVAMHTDIPGLAWPTVSALVQAGVRYFSSGPNYMPNLVPDGGDRIGTTLQETGDRPFWWVSPSGRERLLYWTAGRGYSWFHGAYLGRVGDAAARGILDYARQLTLARYPYEMVQVRYTVGGDNGPVDPKLPELVARWNATHETPRLAIDTTQGLFEAFERRYGRELPERRGDLTPYWEDGALSSAGEEVLARAAARRLLQAEALWALVAPERFPLADAEEAWRQLLLWHEHTWGAAASISEPDRPDVVAQWEYKRAFALEADRRSRALLAGALARRGGGTAGEVDVLNTLSATRAGLVVLPADLSRAGDRARARGGAAPSQRLADGSLAVWLPRAGPLAATRLRVAGGRPALPADRATANETRLENGLVRVELDPATGAIRSLFDRARSVERAGPQGLARYRYVAGLDPALAQDAAPPVIRVEEPGPLVAVLRAEGQAPGARSLVTRYRLVAGSDRVEVEVRLDKSPVRRKESAHLTFDLAVAGGRVRVDQGWNLMEPAKDALPGSCREFVGVHGALDADSGRGGIALGVLDSPLVELGALVDERKSAAGIRSWRTDLARGTTVHAYLLNNYWHTNYKAEQEGLLVFRFVLRVHGEEPAGALTAFSRDLEQPLLVAPAAPAGALRPLALAASADVQVVSLRPAGEGRQRLVRLLNASDREQAARLTGAPPLRLAPWQTVLVRAE
jgi:alpha-mannosidase